MLTDLGGLYTVSYMAKLADIDLPVADAKKAKSNIKSVPVEGDIVTRFNEARDQIDKATELINELKPDLHEAGLQAVFEHNVEHADDPKQIISSVNLLDESNGEIVQFSWSRKNLKNDPKQVVAEFKGVRRVDGKKADINEYAAYAVVAKFDDKVFIVDGKFSQTRYDAFMAALDTVSAKLKVENPLSCGKVLLPKADFHERRWSEFDVETNLAIHSVLPTQVSLEPIRPEKPEDKKKE